MFIDSACAGTKSNAISVLAANNVIVKNIWAENINQGVESHGRVSNLLVSDIFISGSDTFALSVQPSVGDWDAIHDISISNVMINNANVDNLGAAGVWVSGVKINVDKLNLDTTRGYGLKITGTDITISNTIVKNTTGSGFYTYPPVLNTTVCKRIIFDNCKALNNGGAGFEFKFTTGSGVFHGLVYNVASGSDGIKIVDSHNITIMGTTIIDDRTPQLTTYDVGSYTSGSVDYVSVTGNDFSLGKKLLGLTGSTHMIIRSNLGITSEEYHP